MLQKQGELHRHCVDLSYKLNIHYDSPNARNILYYGGSLIDGGKKDFKANILSNQNISNDGSIAGGSAGDLSQYLQMQSLRSTVSASGTSSERTETQTDTTKLPSDDDKKASGSSASDNAISSEPLPPSLEGKYDDDAAGRQFLTMLQESHH